MSKKKNKSLFGCRIPVDYDVWSDIGVLVNIQGIECCFKVMIHPNPDEPYCILWLDILRCDN